MSDAQEIECLEEEVVRLRTALETIKELLPLEEHVYGHYLGGDPRDFIPDRECCSDAEIAAWESACAAVNSGHLCDAEGHSHYIEMINVDGKPQACLASKPGSFGIGIRVFRDPDYAKIHLIIEEALTP